jgi:hypothetical protein
MQRQPMKVKAWIQMGCERRETTFVITARELDRVPPEELDYYVEEAVIEWIQCRYGWGWSYDGLDEDFGFMEDSEGCNLVVVDDELNPNTRRILVPPRSERRLRGKGWVSA